MLGGSHFRVGTERVQAVACVQGLTAMKTNHNVVEQIIWHIGTNIQYATAKNISSTSYPFVHLLVFLVESNVVCRNGVTVNYILRSL